MRGVRATVELPKDAIVNVRVNKYVIGLYAPPSTTLHSYANTQSDLGENLDRRETLPVRQFLPILRVSCQLVKELVNGTTHVDRGKFAMGVGDCTNTTKLHHRIRKRSGKQALLRLTFSNILARGPPPPSPFPKTNNDLSEDSKFWEDARNEQEV